MEVDYAGMMGLGVAFIATPVLGLFGFELKHVIMPWSLLLNGLTAISGAVAYARAKELYIPEGKRGGRLRGGFATRVCRFLCPPRATG